MSDTPKKRGRPASNKSKPVDKSEGPTQEQTNKNTGKKSSSNQTPGFRDDRKLTKKAQESIREKWAGTQALVSRDAMIEQLLGTAKTKFGADKVFQTRDAFDNLTIFLSIPSLPFEYLIANSGFPLDSLMMIAGVPQTFKTALSFEITRWFRENAGFACYVDTESKFSPEFADGIVRNSSDALSLIYTRAHDYETAQKTFMYYLKEIKEKLQGTKDNPGPGKRVPVCFCLDSLAAAASTEVNEKVTKEGFASRGFPVTVLQTKNLLPALKKEISDWPFVFLIINHLSTKTDVYGNLTGDVPGGAALKHQVSYYVRNEVVGKIRNAQFEGSKIRMRCEKNSFGPNRRIIPTRFIWWFEDDPETGEKIKHYLWDWNWSICTLLNAAEGQEKARLHEQDINIICKSASADVECRANLRALGMGKDEYLSFQEVGQMIHENEDVANRIRRALDIKIRKMFDQNWDDLRRAQLEDLE